MKQNNPPMKRRFNGAVLKRLLKMLFGYYPVLLPVSIVCIVFSAITAAIPAIFLKEVTNAITTAVNNAY